jgi:hypothetical protein
MKHLRLLAPALLLGMWATAAWADGGTMLLHQEAGPFTLTLFAAPQPLQAGMADLSVMVQDRRSGEVLLDPLIDLTVALDGAQETVRMARGQATNRLLQAGTVHFSRAGRWRLTLVVQRGNEVAKVSTECIVEPNGSRTLLVWFYVLLAVGVVVLFVIHQSLKLSQNRGVTYTREGR